jgi:hydroxyacylglutathione hydrolase
MFKIRILSFVLTILSLSSLAIYGQSYTSSWFTVDKVADNVWCIGDHGADNMYLVTGRDTAMLIDCGLGVANIRDFVKTLTSLPLIVVNTHGHPDHAGADYQFPEVYINFSDLEGALGYVNLPGKSKGLAGNMTGGATPTGRDIFTDTLNHKPTKMKSLTDGRIFDLGGRKLEVIFVPGHTPGEICLLDSQNKLVFTGDNDNGLVWLHIKGCLPLEVYLRSLEKLNKRSGEFKTILPGHGTPIDAAFISEQIECVKNILAGTCESKDYNTFAGNGKICTYRRATVAFNPDNLREK